ncbi:MAG: phosphate ABC transporter substrate-binding protein [Alphaproteobacteria bacterium]
MFVVVSAVATLAALFIETESLTAEDRLVVTGSSTVAPILGEIVKRYEALHHGVRIDVQTGGSARGLHDTRAGLADIGMVSRRLKPREADLTSYTIALDGLAMIVHAQNPVAELSESRIIGIYTGKIDNWSELGGADAKTVVVSKAEGRSTLELFLDHFGLTSPEIVADIVIGDNEQAVKTVAGNPYAIGYVSIGAASYQVAHGVTIRLLPLNGVPATPEMVAAKRFPILRELNLVVSGEPPRPVADFIAFARSPQVRDILKSFDVVAPGP